MPAASENRPGVMPIADRLRGTFFIAFPDLTGSVGWSATGKWWMRFLANAVPSLHAPRTVSLLRPKGVNPQGGFDCPPGQRIQMSTTKPIFQPTPAQRASMMVSLANRQHWIEPEPAPVPRMVQFASWEDVSPLRGVDHQALEAAAAYEPVMAQGH